MQSLWEDANRTAHEQLLAVLENKKEAVSTADGDVKLNLGSLITNLADQIGIGKSLAEQLPADAGQIEILHSDELKTAQNIAVAIKGLALVLSLLTFLVFGLAIYLSRRGRWVTVLFSGVGADRRRLRRDRRPPDRRRDRRRPAGQDRKREAGGRSGLVDRHLADGQHRGHRDHRRRPLRRRRLARLADQPGAGHAQGDRAGAARATSPGSTPAWRSSSASTSSPPRARACARSSPPWSWPGWRPSASTSCASRPARNSPTPSSATPSAAPATGSSSAVKGANLGERAAKLRLPEVRRPPAPGAPGEPPTPRRRPPRRRPSRSRRSRSTARTPACSGSSGSATCTTKGILTDEEFAAEKARILGGDELRHESPPPGSNRQPPDYKSGALPG